MKELPEINLNAPPENNWVEVYQGEFSMTFLQNIVLNFRKYKLETYIYRQEDQTYKLFLRKISTLPENRSITDKVD